MFQCVAAPLLPRWTRLLPPLGGWEPSAVGVGVRLCPSPALSLVGVQPEVGLLGHVEMSHLMFEEPPFLQQPHRFTVLAPFCDGMLVPLRVSHILCVGASLARRRGCCRLSAVVLL